MRAHVCMRLCAFKLSVSVFNLLSFRVFNELFRNNIIIENLCSKRLFVLYQLHSQIHNTNVVFSDQIRPHTHSYVIIACIYSVYVRFINLHRNCYTFRCVEPQFSLKLLTSFSVGYYPIEYRMFVFVPCETSAIIMVKSIDGFELFSRLHNIQLV